MGAGGRRWRGAGGGRHAGLLAACLFALAGCSAAVPFGEHTCSLPPASPFALPAVAAPIAKPTDALDLPAVPESTPQERPLPINLPTALQLAHVQAVDIAAASARLQVAAAQLEQAQALWLPTVSLGGDYFGHVGPVQDVSNVVFNDSHSAWMLGAGSGIGPAAVLTISDAIFAPLAARQQVRASEANRQAASNDTLVAVTDAYFTVQQARGELAGAIETARLTENLVARTRKLAPAVVPELELFRAETELSRRQTAELQARERWKTAGAELLRVLRLDAAAQVEPLEPPQLRIDLIDVQRPVEELIRVGLASRPELASQQALVQESLERIRQERWRPWLPSLMVRGASTPGGALGAGAFLATPNSNVSGLRGDIDVELLWQLNNLGFGNAALVNQRQAENRGAVVELFRIQDRVAAEVSQAQAQAQLAQRRVAVTEGGVRTAMLSVEKNLAALSQTRGVGNQQVTLVRPQEVVAAIQALAQAYIDYYGAVADANRAQFRLYRALGQPSQYLLREQTAISVAAPRPLRARSEQPAQAVLAEPAPPSADAPPQPSLGPAVVADMLGSPGQE